MGTAFRCPGVPDVPIQKTLGSLAMVCNGAAWGRVEGVVSWLSSQAGMGPYRCLQISWVSCPKVQASILEMGLSRSWAPEGESPPDQLV